MTDGNRRLWEDVKKARAAILAEAGRGSAACRRRG